MSVSNALFDSIQFCWLAGVWSCVRVSVCVTVCLCVRVLYVCVCVRSVDGGWTAWTTWSACSRSCNSGQRSRSRDCTQPPPRHGGEPCSGVAMETVSCSDQPCPSMSTQCCAGSGVWCLRVGRRRRLASVLRDAASRLSVVLLAAWHTTLARCKIVLDDYSSLPSVL